MNTKGLYDSVFPDIPEMQAFEDLIGCFDNLTPVFISRAEYESYGENILKQIEEGGSRLYLPKDLRFIELLGIIDILNKNFELKDYGKLDDILLATKIGVSKILQREGGEQNLEKYIRESGVSEELRDRIVGIDLVKNYSKSKEVINFLKEGESLEQELSGLFGIEFEKVFLRRGIDTLRTGLMVFTQSDATEVDTKDVRISLRENNRNLDYDEQKLRDAINIEGYKKDTVGLKTDEGRLQHELIFLDKLYFYLRQYPFLNDLVYGSSPKYMLEHKSFLCLGATMIIVAILEEAGLIFRLAVSNDHIAVAVKLSSRHFCYIDPSGALEPSTQGIGEGFKVNNHSVQLRDPEDLYWYFLLNLGVKLKNNGSYDEALVIFKRAEKNLSEDKNFMYPYGDLLFKIGEYSEAKRVYEIINTLSIGDSTNGTMLAKTRIEQIKIFLALGDGDFLNKGIILSELYAFEKALGFFQKAIDEDENLYEAHLGKIRVLYYLSRYEESETALQIGFSKIHKIDQFKELITFQYLLLKKHGSEEDANTVLGIIGKLNSKSIIYAVENLPKLLAQKRFSEIEELVCRY
ncbi:hypothetical protein N9J72_01980 [Candidatus Gracilibacteria bacterium]|nr:hypothetical protein [Candidatus Gracilibacteria bacterium]